MPLTVINWNVQWASSRSSCGSEILRGSLTHSPEIICFTEAYTTLQAEAGHVISSEPNYGYPILESSPPCPLFQSIIPDPSEGPLFCPRGESCKSASRP